MTMDRLPKCADCDVDTFDNGEYYMVRDEVWAAAWDGRRRNCDCGGAFDTVGGLQLVFEFNDTRRKCQCGFLCIACLEQRLGRTLTRADFTDCRFNDPDEFFTSARLRSRLENN